METKKDFLVEIKDTLSAEDFIKDSDGFLVITGENHCGKTRLLNTLSSLFKQSTKYAEIYFRFKSADSETKNLFQFYKFKKYINSFDELDGNFSNRLKISGMNFSDLADEHNILKYLYFSSELNLEKFNEMVQKYLRENDFNIHKNIIIQFDCENKNIKNYSDYLSNNISIVFKSDNKSFLSEYLFREERFMLLSLLWNYIKENHIKIYEDEIYVFIFDEPERSMNTKETEDFILSLKNNREYFGVKTKIVISSRNNLILSYFAKENIYILDAMENNSIFNIRQNQYEDDKKYLIDLLSDYPVSIYETDFTGFTGESIKELIRYNFSDFNEGTLFFFRNEIYANRELADYEFIDKKKLNDVLLKNSQDTRMYIYWLDNHPCLDFICILKNRVVFFNITHESNSSEFIHKQMIKNISKKIKFETICESILNQIVEHHFEIDFYIIYNKKDEDFNAPEIMVFDNEVLFKSKTYKTNFPSIVHQFNEYKFISLKKLGIYLDMDFVKHKGQPISSSKSIMNKLGYKITKVEKKRKENFNENENLNIWFKERGFKKRRFEKRSYH